MARKATTGKQTPPRTTPSEADLKENPPPKEDPPFVRAMDNPRPGIFSMTQDASALSDVKPGDEINQDVINVALASGNFKLAAELAELRAKGQTDPAKKRQALFGNHYHVIDPDKA